LQQEACSSKAWQSSLQISFLQGLSQTQRLLVNTSKDFEVMCNNTSNASITPPRTASASPPSEAAAWKRAKANEMQPSPPSSRRFFMSGPYRLTVLSIFLLTSTYKYNAQLFTLSSLSPISWQEKFLQNVPRICFLTAQFAAHVNATDQLHSPALVYRQLYRHAKFLVFTNLQDLQAPDGWKVVRREYPQYNRSITKSRMPKFQGFHDAVVQDHCQVVFYLDGSVDILGTWEDFASDAKRIWESDVGLMQPLHPLKNDVQDAFDMIRRYGKDTIQNLKITQQWLSQQPDYSPQIPVYQNMYFGYSVQSPIYQQIADYFWSIYSTEVGSWRDQPLWAYTLRHFNITPLDFQGFESSGEENPKRLFKRNPHREGMNGHTYAAKWVRPKYSGIHRNPISPVKSPVPRPSNATRTGSNTGTTILDRMCRLRDEHNITLSQSFEERCKEIELKSSIEKTP
jgi:hypothetical protein